MAQGRRRRIRAAALLGTAPLWTMATAAAAQERDWDGSASSDWFAADNWTPAGPPTNGDDVEINTVTPNPTVIAAAGAVSADITIGGDGGTGNLTIQAGGSLVSSGDAIIGDNGGVGEVRVTGAGSRWTIDGSLLLGAPSPSGGTFGTLRIDSGGTVTSDSVLVNQLQGRSSLIDARGNGTTWNTGGFTASGLNNLAGNLVTVADGATMNSTSAALFSRMLVTGAGTVWNSAALIVGSPSGINPGRLTIADGAVVNSSAGQIGGSLQGAGSGSTSSGVVDVSGGRWNVDGDVRVGIDALNTGALVVRGGGTAVIDSGSGTLFVGPGSRIAIGGAADAAPGTLDADRVDLASTARLVFSHNSTSYVFDPQITGSGNIDVTLGTTILTANSTEFTGTTTIFDGAELRLGNGVSSGSGVVIDRPGPTGAIGGDIVNNGALVIYRTGTLALDGIISGTGSLRQRGTVTTTITADNTYTGATTIDGGRLLVNGSIASSSSVTVNGGGTLGGTGTVASTSADGGATLAPGTSIGTLTVSGDLTLGTANYLAEVAPASADLLSITGNASLDGRIVAIATGDNYAPGQYTLLTATGGRTGTFSTFATDGNFGGLFAALSYDANKVFLNLSVFTGGVGSRWAADPATANWNTGTNWVQPEVPIGTATFGPSTRTTVTFSPGTTQIGTLLFEADAPAYTFQLNTRLVRFGGGDILNLLGAGIVNNSASRPIIYVTAANSAVRGGAALNFMNASTAGNAHITNFTSGGGIFGATTFYQTSSAADAIIDNVVGEGTAFRDSSTAGNATINNGTADGPGGATGFFDTSNAGNATINNPLDIGGVVFFDSSSAGAARIVNRSSTAFNFGRSGLPVVGVTFYDSSSAGTATITNDGGNTGFFGTSTAANATIVNSGSGAATSFFSTIFFQDSTAGSATITNNIDGVTVFTESSTAANATIVNNDGGSTSFYITTDAGTATITNNAGGSTHFFGRSAGGSATIINNAGGLVDISEDPLQTPSLVAPSVAIGSLSGDGDVLLGSRNLALGNLGRNDAIGGVIADGGPLGGTGGSLTKVGAGTLILSGNNTYTGGTTIEAGTLQLGAGGAAGSVVGNIVNDGALVIDRTGALALNGIISGTGSLTQSGTVTTTLGGDNSYTGATIVNGGTLLVTGSIASSDVTVNAGATLGGTGTVGDTIVADGGTIAPGTSIGTLSVGGNLIFADGSTFLVEVAPASADLLSVTGSASLAGTLGAIATGGTYAPGQEYEILTAGGGITGMFGAVTIQGDFSGLAAELRYEANNVFLVLTRAGPTNTATTSLTDAIVFNAPTIEERQVSLFRTQIVGRLSGGAPLFDQTFDAAFSDPVVQAGLASARLAITTAGGPGVIVLIGPPTLVERNVTSVTTSSSVFTLAVMTDTVTTTTTFGGPGVTVTIGDARSCGTAVATLPSGTRPDCGEPGGQSFDVAAGSLNINTETRTDYFVDELRTDTTTTTTFERYQLNGTVVPVGTVHAAVQSGLFELGGRFLRRIGEEGVPGLFGEPGSPASDGTSALAADGGGHRGWAQAYGSRSRGDARDGLPAERRDAWGLSGGFSFGAAPGLLVGFGVDHGRLDLDVPGSGEQADVELTQVGAVARFGAGPFSVGVAAVYGFGSVDSRRDFMGIATGAYDVNLWGAFAEARYRFEAGAWRIVPSIALDHVRVESQAFAEAGPLGLSAPEASRSRTGLSPGLEVGRSFAAGASSRIDVAGWARADFVLSGEERTLPVAFNLAPGTPLVMRGLSERDSAALGGQVALHLSRSASLYLGYEGRFASGYDAHAGVAGLRLVW